MSPKTISYRVRERIKIQVWKRYRIYIYDTFAYRTFLVILAIVHLEGLNVKAIMLVTACSFGDNNATVNK